MRKCRVGGCPGNPVRMPDLPGRRKALRVVERRRCQLDRAGIIGVLVREWCAARRAKASGDRRRRREPGDTSGDERVLAAVDHEPSHRRRPTGKPATPAEANAARARNTRDSIADRAAQTAAFGDDGLNEASLPTLTRAKASSSCSHGQQRAPTWSGIHPCRCPFSRTSRASRQRVPRPSALRRDRCRPP